MSFVGLTAGNTLNEKEVKVGSNNNFLVTTSKETRDISENSLIIDIDPEKSK